MDDAQPIDLELAAGLVSALDSPLRLRILLLLSSQPHVVHQLVRKLEKSQPLISQHLRVLKQSHLVEYTRTGREVVYELAHPEIIEVIRELGDLAAHLKEGARTLVDDLAARRANSEGRSPQASAAIIGPPADVRAERDPGLRPATARPSHE
ncbi:transcriptional regulator [Corynebacterium liangguodongii]|uniref:Transcriptional regulator n=1 Tax=Corynebacterium liangguodongii TaxID=2079535 RepID=A0A2S0WFC3_9CORY|nr:helix-turn-helix domain-containing protein [Corynebacterium liangguodongii]AWB84459.1 transcriptional regulator [Corynebacterium liangguodongii]